MIQQISVEDLHALMPARLVDVREEWEYDQAHVPGSEWIPMSLVPLRVDEFAGHQPTYVICRTGNRSGQVVMWLDQRGIQAVNVHGGIEAWQRAGFPVASMSGSTR